MATTETEKLAEGVPLAVLYKREIELSPELVMLSDPRSVHAERFRRLKTRLSQQHDPRVLVVTSGIPGEGKSTVAFNLALAFAGEASEKTLLIDADLRRPSLGRHLKPVPQLGLAEVVSGRADLVHAVLHVKNSALDILPAGDAPREDPLELLASDGMRKLIGRFREDYDRVVIDSPPIVPFTDADVLGALADGIVMVVRAGVTPKSVHLQALQSVTAGKILGTVLNAAPRRRFGDSSGYDHYYREYYDRERQRT